jgi:primosomal protein N' (replication factor Y)
VKYITDKLPKRVKNFLFPEGCRTNIQLFPEQQEAYESVSSSVNSLLWGITGSGKTEVFFQLIDKNIQAGFQTLILLPEIAITEAISSRFKKTFGFDAVIWHSTSQSSMALAGIMRGELPVVIGSRSSILLPFKNLASIIVDEEHDRSYKQEVHPCYHARDMAFLRSKIEGCRTVFASATPSLESYRNYKNGMYSLARINKRYGDAKLPKISVVPNYATLLNDRTIEKTKHHLSLGNQVVFYLNKRGFASFSKCKSCMNTINCADCNSILSWHKQMKVLLCHQCNKKYPVAVCPYCNTYGSIASYGIGVEKLAQNLIELFPGKNVYTASSDFLEKRSQIIEFIEKMKSGEIDIVSGTQIVSKGHDFPGIALIVVVNFTDAGFDFRAAETNMQNLIQITGRAGRAGVASEVLIQTSQPKSSTITFLQNNDYEGFLESELERRKLWDLPPYCRVVALKSSTMEEVQKAYNLLKNNFLCHPPTESFLFFKKYYYMIIKTQRNKAAIEVLKHAIKGLKVSVNIDPYDLYL